MSNQPPESHFGYVCRQCGISEFTGRRYACWICIDYQICGACYDAGNLPQTDEHKYYHPLETHYTRAEFELHFGGETYVESAVPQSYKCAMCENRGFTISDLMMHLFNVHGEHQDYCDYLNMLWSRYSAETATLSGQAGAEAAVTVTVAGAAATTATATAALATTVKMASVPQVTATTTEAGNANSQPERFVLEIIRNEPSNDCIARSCSSRNSRIWSMARQRSRNINIHTNTNMEMAFDLLQELHELNPTAPEYDARCFDILRRARALVDRPQRVDSMEDQYDLGSIVQIIEQEIGDSARLRQPVASQRRGGLVPGSNAAAAVGALANVTSGSAVIVVPPRAWPPLPPIGLGLNRRYDAQVRRLSPSAHENWQSIMQDARNVQMRAHLGRTSAMHLNISEVTPRTAAAAPPPPRPIQLPGEAPSTTAPNRNERHKSLQEHYADMMRRMVGAPREFRPVLSDVKEQVETRSATDAAKLEEHAGEQENGQFLCAQFGQQQLQSGQNDRQQNTVMLQHAGFAEALICSMLAEEQLAHVQFKYEVSTTMSNARNETETKTDEKLPVEAVVAASAPATTLGVALMTRFYRGLKFYNKWLHVFADRRGKVAGQAECSTGTRGAATELMPETRFEHDDDDTADELCDESQEQQLVAPNEPNTTPHPQPQLAQWSSPIVDVGYIDLSDDDDDDEDEDEGDNDTDDDDSNIDQDDLPADQDEQNESIVLANLVNQQPDMLPEIDVNAIENDGHDSEVDNVDDVNQDNNSGSETSESTIALMVHEIDEVYFNRF